jgi:hypothetical protein
MRAFCLKATMINIVGKFMLPDIPRGCQDEYAATRFKAQNEGKSLAFAEISRTDGRRHAASILNIGRMVIRREVLNTKRRRPFERRLFASGG